MDKTSLGDRMKAYENVERRYLPHRAPIILRLDGVAFHSYTHGFDKPFDDSLLWCMRMTMLQLCEHIMGAKLAYHQSDEISILITDDDTLDTQPWFGKNLQKIVSVAAAEATFFFNKNVTDACGLYGLETPVGRIRASKGLHNAFISDRMAIFDARAFTLPREEALNAIEWRQQDAIRNSIQAVGQHYFSQKELHGKSCAEIKDMLLSAREIDWHEYPIALQRGTCAIKVPTTIYTPEGELNRMKWTIDTEIPIFHEQPNYINDLVYHKVRN